jgi:hypothetical protein
MKITTETGSVYDIDKYGMCIKTDKNGERIDMFKLLVTIPVPHHVKLVKEIYTLPQGEPIIGQRLYLSGLNTWWLTTPVVSVDLTKP